MPNVDVPGWTGETWDARRRWARWEPSLVRVHRTTGAVRWSLAPHELSRGRHRLRDAQQWSMTTTDAPCLELYHDTKQVAVGWGATPEEAATALQLADGRVVTLAELADLYGGAPVSDDERARVRELATTFRPKYTGVGVGAPAPAAGLGVLSDEELESVATFLPPFVPRESWATVEQLHMQLADPTMALHMSTAELDGDGIPQGDAVVYACTAAEDGQVRGFMVDAVDPFAVLSSSDALGRLVVESITVGGKRPASNAAPVPAAALGSFFSGTAMVLPVKKGERIEVQLRSTHDGLLVAACFAGVCYDRQPERGA